MSYSQSSRFSSSTRCRDGNPWCWSSIGCTSACFHSKLCLRWCKKHITLHPVCFEDAVQCVIPCVMLSIGSAVMCKVNIEAFSVEKGPAAGFLWNHSDHIHVGTFLLWRTKNTFVSLGWVGARLLVYPAFCCWVTTVWLLLLHIQYEIHINLFIFSSEKRRPGVFPDNYLDCPSTPQTVVSMSCCWIEHIALTTSWISFVIRPVCASHLALDTSWTPISHWIWDVYWNQYAANNVAYIIHSQWVLKIPN